MALTQRQMACFESNKQFQAEVAAALLPIAAAMMRGALVVLSTPESTEVQQTFAAIHKNIANQILQEQGVNVQALGTAGATATGGSTGMKYLVQQLLTSAAWTLTPDQWAANEEAARTAIAAGLAALLAQLTAIPGQEPEPPAQATKATATKAGRSK